MQQDINVINWNIGDEIPQEMLDLYISAFPVDERRDWITSDDIANFLTENPCVNLRLYYYGDEFAGFAIYWVFKTLEKTICYIEHLAVPSDMRGQRIGSKILQNFIAQKFDGIILEVEPPAELMQQRRIEFYKKHNFQPHYDITYFQPPYRESGEPVQLILMSYGDISDIISSTIVPLIHQKVYRKLV